jgi:hypothetical protein
MPPLLTLLRREVRSVCGPRSGSPLPKCRQSEARGDKLLDGFQDTVR